MRARPGVKATREDPYISERGLDGPVDGSLVVAVQAAVAKVTGGAVDATPDGVPYGTDATHLWGLAGIPTVVIGPGDIAQAHTIDEWVDLSDVRQCTEVYYEVMRSFVQGEWS